VNPTVAVLAGLGMALMVLTVVTARQGGTNP
jgi:hypothetical protein